MYQSQFFSIKELSCQCGCGLYNMKDDFMRRLDALRKEYGLAIIKPGGCRCPEHNAKVGGKPNSKHLTGEAVDIPTHNSALRGLLLELAVKHKFMGIGIASSFVHIDHRDGPRLVWVY